MSDVPNWPGSPMWKARAEVAERKLKDAERHRDTYREAYRKNCDKLARVRELAEAADELFRWIEREWPKVLVEAPTPIMQRLRQASAALDKAAD